MNIPTRTQHLSDTEFGDLLAGYLPCATAEAHLAHCEHCQRELDVVQSSLGSFRALGTAWAQAEAPKRIPVPSLWSRCLGARPSWGAGVVATALTAVLAVGLGFPSGHSNTAATVTPSPVPPSTTELANDNRLMLSIDQELSNQAQPAVPASQLREEARRDNQRPGGTELD